MTPEQEYLAYVRRDIDCGVLNEQGALELVAKLETAWAERDTLNVDAKAWLDNCRKERERAERAEALCDAVVQTYETRLARVRELVDEADGEPKRLFWPSEIRAAIEGDGQ